MSPAQKQIEILVVEKDPADTQLTQTAFRAAGLTRGFRSVTDGDDAIAYVRGEGKYAGVPIPDLIFLDLSLSKTSGLAVLREIKLTPPLIHVPIVIASGSDDLEDMRAVYALTGNCFIRKPADLTQFLRFIEMCFRFWVRVVTPRKSLK